MGLGMSGPPGDFSEAVEAAEAGGGLEDDSPMSELTSKALFGSFALVSWCCC